MFCFRFTELFVEELENESDLRILVADYLKGLNLSKSVINGIIRSASSLCSKQNLFPYRILKNSIAFEATSSYKNVVEQTGKYVCCVFLFSFYLTIREEAHTHLVGGTGQKPHYSLRTLCRALKYVAANPCYSIQRSLYEVGETFTDLGVRRSFRFGAVDRLCLTPFSL